MLIIQSSFQIISFAVRSNVEQMKNAILKPEDSITGGLIDSYVAGAYQEQLAESTGLRVSTVFDHQFAYGFAITNSLAKDSSFERCMRRSLSTKESEITTVIQKKMKALPVSKVISLFLKE